MTNDEKIQFANAIEQVLEEEGIDKEQANNVRQTLLAKSKFYAGPIPSASELEKYEQILPNAAERILTLAEKQSKHRREFENKALIEETSFNKRGQILGFLVSILVLIVALVAILTGQGIIGLGAIFISIASIVTAFYFPK